jgi:hypothetical protein
MKISIGSGVMPVSSVFRRNQDTSSNHPNWIAGYWSRISAILFMIFPTLLLPKFICATSKARDPRVVLLSVLRLEEQWK